MTWEKEEGDRLISQRIGELFKNITRKKILAIARQHGWEIVSAGKEPLKARKQGYHSIPIPGRNDGAVIANGTAFKIVKALVQPSIDEEKYATTLEAIQYELARQKTRADRAEYKLAQAQQTIVKLQTDVEAGLDLADETEHHNNTLQKTVHRYSRWIEKLKAKITKLIQQRAQQEEEMLKIADAVEQQEIRRKNSVARLTQFSGKLSPKLQRDLQKIIRYLKEEGGQILHRRFEIM
ncbi:hypothetical protein HC931_22230 [Candidatus Gracilibacteria bacterium]|nr:hypothetical protein [Candidatus Gracilibacteria bacterium]